MVCEAVRQAVEAGDLWLVSGPSSCWKDEIPAGVLDENAALRPPPALVPARELTAEALPGAWDEGETNGAAVERALSHERGEPVPWGLVRESISAAVNSRWLDVVAGDPAGGYVRAGSWRLKRPEVGPVPDGAAWAEASAPAHATVLEVSQIQDLAEVASDLLEAGAGHGLRFHVDVSLDADAPADARAAVDNLLDGVAPGFRSRSESSS